MLPQRAYLGLVLGALALLPACCATRVHAAAGVGAKTADVQTKESQSALSPRQALDRLMQGNARFCAGTSMQRDLPAQVHATAGGQFPIAAIVSCMDSRTSCELVLDQGLGDIFNVRVAGNVIDDDVLASLEYAAKVAGTRLFLVIGHSSCGAIKAAADNVTMGNVPALVARIKPALDAVPASEQPRTSKNHEFVDHVAAANVRHSMQQILEGSPVLRELADSGQILLVGGMYDVETGRVEIFDR